MTTPQMDDTGYMRGGRHPGPAPKAQGARPRLPVPALVLVVGVILCGVGALAIRIPEVLAWTPRDLWAYAGLAAAISVVELFPLRFRHATEIQYLSLTDALWAAGLLLLLAPGSGLAGPRPGVLTMAVGVGALVGQAVQKRNPLKSVFNIGQWLLAITVAEVLFRAAGPSTVDQPRAWLAAGVAMAACFLVNNGLTGLVIALVERRSFRDVVGENMGLNAAHWAGNLALGVTVAVVWKRAPLALPLLSVPLALSYFAYRAWLSEAGRRDRMRTLYQASMALVGPLDASLNMRPFLLLVRRLLEAEAAEIVVVRGDSVTIHSEEGTESLVAGSGNGSVRPQAYVRVRDGVTPQVSVVGGPDDVRGVLALYRRAPLSEADRSLLDALASQVRLRLINQRLYAEILDERTGIADVIAHAPDGVFVLSDEGRIVSWNPAMERLTGRQAALAVGKASEEVFGPSQPDTRDLADAQGDEDETILLVHPDGSERWIRCRRAPLHDRSGTVTGSVVTVRDITGEVEHDRLKADFVATVSHELRNPLTPLKGFINTLLLGTGEDSPEARQEYYRIMDKQVGRLERLIADLLEVSRIEAGHLPLEVRPFDLTALVSGDVKAFSETRRLQVRAPATPVHVLADPTRTEQVFTNLLSNALKYSQPDTSVEVTVASAGEQAIVSVRDEGEGIPPEEQELVFDRFHRAERGLAKKQEGTGLGLYIAKRLVEAMGGSIWLVSSPGHGSTFSFSLPLAATDSASHPSGAGIQVDERARA
jgi:PAS domain S-box-containing protein